jgi:hypothetical protein
MSRRKLKEAAEENEEQKKKMRRHMKVCRSKSK